MINLDKEKYLGATADTINDYNWILKDKIVNNLDSVTENIAIANRSQLNIWDPLELKIYLRESI